MMASERHAQNSLSLSLSLSRNVLASPAACACLEIGHVIYSGLLLHQVTACTAEATMGAITAAPTAITDTAAPTAITDTVASTADTVILLVILLADTAAPTADTVILLVLLLAAGILLPGAGLLLLLLAAGVLLPRAGVSGRAGLAGGVVDCFWKVI